MNESSLGYTERIYLKKLKEEGRERRIDGGRRGKKGKEGVLKDLLILPARIC